MLKSDYRDLIATIILSIASLAFLTIPALDQYPINLVPQLLILLFLPGYALVAVIDPRFNRKSIIKRVTFSFTVSLLLTIISTFIPVEVSGYLVLVILAVVLSILAFFRRGMSSAKLIPRAVTKDGMKGSEREDRIPGAVNKENKLPSKRRFFPDLVLVIILNLLCALFVLEPTLNKTILRTVLGLLMVLFLPGYALIASLFPKRYDLDAVERLALSFGLSIAITPLIGLALNYTPFGIRLDPILISLTTVTLLLCTVAYLRRSRTPEEYRFSFDFSGIFRGLMEGFQGESKTGKILSVILIISLILAIATTAYIIVEPKKGESFTEFYILGPSGKASDYPTNLAQGQTGSLIIGIVNYENKKTSYRVLVTSNNTVQLEQTVTLDEGQKMEIPFNFTGGEPGEKKMEFLLFKLPDNDNIYRSLHLWLNITGSPTEISKE